MKVVLSVFLAFLAVVGFAHPANNILQDLQEVAKMPRENWVAALKNIVQKRNTRNDVDDAIMALLEKLREIMPVGIPELDIPPLEPYYLEHYTLDLSGTGLPAIKIVVDKATIVGLSKFVINDIHNDLENRKADYNFTMPMISANGQYDISGTVAGMELFGNGPFTMDMGPLTAWGTVEIGSENNSLDGKVFMKSISVDFILEKLNVKFDNLMGGGSLGDMLNQVISEEGPAMLQEYEAEVDKIISEIVISIANPILHEFTLREILDYLGVPHPN